MSEDFNPKLGEAVLEYGPFKFPVTLHGTDRNGFHTYEYGVVTALPDQVTFDQALIWKDTLFATANGPFAFGIKTLYIVGEDGIPVGPPETEPGEDVIDMGNTPPGPSEPTDPPLPF